MILSKRNKNIYFFLIMYESEKFIRKIANILVNKLQKSNFLNFKLVSGVYLTANPKKARETV